MQVAQEVLSVVSDALTPSKEHFEWVLLCEQQQQVAGARGRGEPLGFRPSSSFHMSHVTFRTE